MRMGGRRQHVGTLRKQRLYDAVYDALKVCEIGIIGECYRFTKIDKHAIVYNAGKNKWASNAYLRLIVRGYFNQEFKGLQELW